MRGDLEAQGLRIVTVCSDTNAEIRAGSAKHGLHAVMLADPDLVITDRYDLRNPTNLTPKGMKPMPIPTTLLLDAQGRVRWIDQSENYQVRAHPERVRAALAEALA